MTANASVLGSLAYKDEAAWGENVTSMAAAIRLPIITPVDLSGLTHEMLDPSRTTQYLNEGTPGVRGVMGGGFSFDVWLAGHGAATSGATAATDLGDLLGWVLGANAQSFANGTTDNGGGASTPTSITTAASGTGSQGGLFRAGVKGDGRADGQ